MYSQAGVVRTNAALFAPGPRKDTQKIDDTNTMYSPFTVQMMKM